MKKAEQILGFIVIILALLIGTTFLKPDMLFRLVIGIGLGYSLMRAYTGFAGSVNRAFNTGSTKLMRTMMFMFFISCILTTAFLFKADPTTYSLWINPINFGLLLGGLLFGFGMALSSCCASGVLTDLVTGLPRAFVTLVFFGLGVYLGFPVQNTASWVKQSWFTSPVGQKLAKGVFLPDLFKWDGLNGYLGALVLTAIFCGIAVYISYCYERRRKENNTYTGHNTEIAQDLDEKFDSKQFKLFSEATYNRYFVKPWTLKQGAIALSILFAILMGVTKAGWGASTPYGIWFGKVLMVFGVSADSVAAFAKMKPDAFIQPFFQNAVSVQNFGIILGTAIYLLTAGVFKKIFMSEMHITLREVLLFALGGLSMGFGTRLSNGCNVGALYTPIANFSLSGWIFLIFLVLGAITGNILAKKAFAR
ncbi:putative inner membrane protein [Pelotomaculum schinkii]|uniref:Putative inner membrane protein n=1 Tax=Pelotomaculum schinkii TaxID=78350 RepID=A0A4Y7R6V9_9FIRM|nr:YeeE/YedE family protein [Pelotomaculum schinkii]TEB04381.1 putative inner membrane protein [Pelotomaculum schinkii]